MGQELSYHIKIVTECEHGNFAEHWTCPEETLTEACMTIGATDCGHLCPGGPRRLLRWEYRREPDVDDFSIRRRMVSAWEHYE